MTASPLFAAEHLCVVLAGRLAQGCRAARALRSGPWPAEDMTAELAERVLDVRTPELHWTAIRTGAGPVDVWVQPDGPGTRRLRVPGMQVVARVPFSGTPALLEAQPRRVRHGRPGTARATVTAGALEPLVYDAPEVDGGPVTIPLSGYVTFTTEGRTHDAAAWERELGDWAEFVVWTTLDAAAEVAAWRTTARAELELAVLERRAQLDAVAGVA